MIFQNDKTFLKKRFHFMKKKPAERVIYILWVWIIQANKDNPFMAFRRKAQYISEIMIQCDYYSILRGSNL